MKAKRTTKRKTRVFTGTLANYTSSNNTQGGEIIWYPAKKESFIETTLKYLKGWFR